MDAVVQKAQVQVHHQMRQVLLQKLKNYNKSKDAGVLKVGTSAEYSPYEFHKVVDGEDKIVGFDDFLVQEIAKDMGVKVEYEDMDFDGLLGASTS